MSALPTGERWRTPTTTSAASVSSGHLEDRLGDVGDDLVAHRDVEAACLEVGGDRRDLVLVGVARVDQGVALGGVDDDERGVAAHGLGGPVVQGGLPVGVGGVGDDDAHALTSSFSVTDVGVVEREERTRATTRPTSSATMTTYAAIATGSPTSVP